MRKTKKKKEAHGATQEAQEETQGAADSTEGLRPVPAENASKLKFTKKIILGAGLVLLLGALLILTKKQSSSQILIKTQKEKFKVDFAIQEKDKARASNFVEKLGIPPSIMEGFEFALDSTASARLAFTNPITLNLNFTQDSVSFSGNSHSSLSDTLFNSPGGFKLPASVKIALFSQDFRQLIIRNYSMPAGLQQWIEKNISNQNGQYLMIFGDDNSFVMVSQKNNVPDFSGLEQIKGSEIEPLYKQETDSQITIHLVRLPQEETTLAFFEIGNWLFVASSLESAKNTISVQKGEAPLINFPSTEKNVSFAAFFKKSENSAGALSLFTENNRIAKYLENIKQALLVISGSEIEGYIDF